jgi:FKBP-type peptidyl-prolyl cis-trans isomerase SlyD
MPGMTQSSGNTPGAGAAPDSDSIRSGLAVTVRLQVYDADNELVIESDGPITYLQGGGEIFPRLEGLLEGKHVGDTVSAYLEPADHFGDYDAELVYLEDRKLLPPDIEVGSQIERSDDDDPDAEPVLVTVTDIQGETVVLDGNHPFAGSALRFEVEVLAIEEPEVDADGAFDAIDDEDDLDAARRGGLQFRTLKRTLH